jgi:hypothetical protein
MLIADIVNKPENRTHNQLDMRIVHGLQDSFETLEEAAHAYASKSWGAFKWHIRRGYIGTSGRKRLEELFDKFLGDWRPPPPCRQGPETPLSIVIELTKDIHKKKLFDSLTRWQSLSTIGDVFAVYDQFGRKDFARRVGIHEDDIPIVEEAFRENNLL